MPQRHILKTTYSYVTMIWKGRMSHAAPAQNHSKMCEISCLGILNRLGLAAVANQIPGFYINSKQVSLHNFFHHLISCITYYIIICVLYSCFSD